MDRYLVLHRHVEQPDKWALVEHDKPSAKGPSTVINFDAKDYLVAQIIDKMAYSRTHESWPPAFPRVREITSSSSDPREVLVQASDILNEWAEEKARRRVAWREAREGQQESRKFSQPRSGDENAVIMQFPVAE